MVDWGLIVTVVLLIILVIPVALYLFGVVTLNIAEYDKEKCDFPQGVCEIGQKVGFPQGFLRTDKVLFYAIMPLLGIWLIIYGFLDKVKIFKGSINGALAFVMAFSTVPLGLFIIIVAAMFSVMGIYSVVAFAIMFFVGIFFYARKKLLGYPEQFRVYEKQAEYHKELAETAEKRAKEAEKRLEKKGKELEKKGVLSPYDRQLWTEFMQKEMREIRTQKGIAKSEKKVAKEILEEKKRVKKQLKEAEKSKP